MMATGNKQRSNFRILIATGLYPPEIGGPATYSALLAKELPNRGIAVDVLPFSTVRFLPKVIRHLVYFLKCLYRIPKHDAVYAQDPVSVGLPALIAAKMLRRKFIIRVAGDYAWEQAVQRFGVGDNIDDFQRKKYNFRTEFLRKTQAFVVNGADLVITPSHYFRELVSGWVTNGDRIKTVYNGIQLANNRLSMTGRSETQKTILSAGRLVSWKGFDILVELMDDLPDWKLVIVGDGPEQEKLALLIAQRGLQSRVKLAGAVSRGKLLEYLRGAGIFILNTRFESFSFQIVEAMNAGVPVITTNVCNLAEIIEDGREGILVEPNNKQQILSAIQKIKQEQDFRDLIIRNAQLKARRFSIQNTVSNLVNLFQNL